MQPSCRAPAGAFGRVLALYHYPCPDGVFAALATHLHYKSKAQHVEFVPSTVYAPRSTQELALKGDELVYLLDYAGPPGFAVELARLVRRVCVLDHHKTAAAHLAEDAACAPAGSLEVVMDLGRSGATIARDYFGPLELTDSQARLFELVEDADLWRWAVPGSRAFHAALGALRLEYDASANPAVFDQLLRLDPRAMVESGEALLAEQAALIAAAVARAAPVALGGTAGAAAGWGAGLGVRVGADLAALRSSLGNELAAEAAARGLRPVGVVAYVEEAMGDASKLKVSLRSIGEEDTTRVSEAHGGGGHRNASSFIVDAAEYASWEAAQ